MARISGGCGWFPSQIERHLSQNIEASRTKRVVFSARAVRERRRVEERECRHTEVSHADDDAGSMPH